MTTKPQANEQIERIIDAIGIEQTMAAIAEVCHDKAEHMMTNWADRAGMGAWTRHAKVAEHAQIKCGNVNRDYIGTTKG